MFYTKNKQGSSVLKNANLILFNLIILNSSLKIVNCVSEWTHEGSDITFKAINSDHNSSTLSSICQVDPNKNKNILIKIRNTDFQNYYLSFIVIDHVNNSEYVSQNTIGDPTLSQIAKQLTDINISTNLLENYFDFSIQVTFRAKSSARFTITVNEPAHLFVNDFSSKGDCLPDKGRIFTCSNREGICESDYQVKNGTNSGKGLSDGQIAGIVIGSVIGLLLIVVIVALVYYYVFYRNKSKEPVNVLPAN